MLPNMDIKRDDKLRLAKTLYEKRVYIRLNQRTSNNHREYLILMD